MLDWSKDVDARHEAGHDEDVALFVGRLRPPWLFLLRRRRFHRPHVEIEQAFALVALVLVLLPQLDDLLEDLHIEALALGLRKDFLLLLVQLLQFGVEILDPLDERTDSCRREW